MTFTATSKPTDSELEAIGASKQTALEAALDMLTVIKDGQSFSYDTFYRLYNAIENAANLKG